MSERALRGTRLGATSYETDSGIDLAPRQDVEYACPSGHRFQMPFSVEAEVPMVWECRVCGAQALRVGGVVEEDKPVKPVRTHWDMLLERRSIPELEEVLAERLEVLRGGGASSAFGSRSMRRTPPVNLATGAPAPEGGKPHGAGPDGAKPAEGKAAGDGGPGDGGARADKSSAPKATTSTATKKAPAKKTTAGTAPAKKTAASRQAAPATRTTSKPVKKTAAKKPSAK